MRPRKTITVNGTTIQITPDTTADDLRTRVDALDHEHLTMWHRGTLYYWTGDQHVYSWVQPGDTLKFGDVSGHPAAP